MNAISIHSIKGNKAFAFKWLRSPGRYLLLLLTLLFNTWTAWSQSTQTFSATGTWLAPAGVTTVTVECWGGGGRGGSTSFNGTETGGGGGGAYAKKNSVAVTAGTSYTATVGAGSTSTSAGGDSWFSTSGTVMAKGGSSVGQSSTGGAGGSGTSSIGDVKFSGGNGANGSSGNYGGGGGSSAGTAAAGANATNQNGATAPSGGGNGGAGRSGSNGNGVDGVIPGGGGGGVVSGTFGSQTGGDGANGKVVVTWTCPTYALNSTSVSSGVCTGNPVAVVLSAGATSLPTGSYTVTYSLSGANTGSGLTASMTVSTAGSGTFNIGSLSNGGSTTVTITNLSSGSGVATCSNSVSSGNSTTFTVIGVNAGSISGTQNVCLNGDPTLLTSSVAGSGSGTVTYQWESSTTSGSSGFTSISGATSDSYDPPSGFATTTWYRRVTIVTSGATSCQATTTAIQLTLVGTNFPSVTASSSSSSTCVGGTVNLSATTNSSFSSSVSPNLSIPDNNATGITSLINASGLPTSLSGWQVRVTVNITHTYTSDVEIYLARPGGAFGTGVSPNQVGTIAGQSIRLSNDNGGSGDGYNNCTFRDDAGSNVTTQTGNVTISGNYIPEELFTTLAGNPNGNWTLRVTDDANTDVGTLVSWTLQIIYPGGLSYSWTSAPSGFSSAIQNPTGVVVNENTTYSVTLTDNSSGCTKSANVAVSTLPNPSPNVIPGDTILCNGNDFFIHVVDTGAYAISGYPAGSILEWVNIITQLFPNDSINVNGNGSSYQAKVTLPSGCSAYSPVRTMLTKAVVANATTLKHATCNLSNGKIVATMSGATAPMRYVWKQDAIVIRDTISYEILDSITNLVAGNYSLEITDNYGNLLPTEPSCTGGPFAYVINNVAPPSVSVNITNISCFGQTDGTIHALPNAGTPPYSYLWSNNSTNQTATFLSAGSYTVTVTDMDGCSVEGQGTVIEPGLLNLILSFAEPLCTGNSDAVVAASIGGGTPPFTYEWYDINSQLIGTNNDSLFNVPAGTYYFNVQDANYCSVFDSITVTDPPLLTAVCSATDATCFGDSNGGASVSASGGRGTYSFLWSNNQTSQNISSLPAGTYTLTVTDGNGCIAQCSSVVAEPAQVSGVAIGSDVACIDGQTTVAVTGTGGTAPYTGEGSFTVGVGTHVFPITDVNGCTGSVSKTINHLDIDAPVISNCPIDITQCGSIVTWVAPGASDNCTLVSFTSNFNSGDSFPVGTTQVVYTATDNAGLVNTCSFNVTVLPTPLWYQDNDNDGFGNALVSLSDCVQPLGYVSNNSDCDDTQLLYADADGDSYGAGAPVACGVASSNDCNDAVAAINPGAAEVCNNIDDNCNGLTDDGLVFVTYYADADGDGFGNALVSQSTCNGAPAGFILDNSDCDDTQLLYVDADGDTYGAGAPVACGVASSNDCNDAVAAINPGAAEVCNLIDDDCDGLTDEGVQLTFYADTDGDAYGDPAASVLACVAPVGYVADNTDCNDAVAAINPAAIEICNLIDDDCDGSTDEGVQLTFYADTDGDAYGDPAASVLACVAPVGYVADNTDCNDAVAVINPGATEVCNNIDDNCNGLTDDGLVFVTYYADADGDGFGNALVSQSTCNGAPAGFILDNSDCDDTQLLYVDADGDTYGAGAPVACGVASSNDCNDAVAAINPGAAEVCNLIDDDCDGLTDEGVQLTFYADTDGDAYGDPAASVLACVAPVGYVADNTDCNDAVAAINPAAIEICNLIDDDCDGSTDEGVQLTFYADTDGDAYGDPAASVLACVAPVGYVADNTDCNDAVAVINPGAAEVCNNIDDNCNSLTDDGLVFVTYYADADGDGFGNALVSQSTCNGAPAGFIIDNSDCNDAQFLYTDQDGDTYGAGTPVACGVASSNDCNDLVAAINPGTAEVCNNIDDDCNGLTDDGLLFITYYADADGDGFGNALVSQSTCDGAPAGYVINNNDCDDTQILYADADGDTYGAGAAVACGVASSNDCNDAVASINPGAAEVCNNIDDNCNGLTDDGLVFVTYYADADGDGFGNALVSQSTCNGAPAGFILDNSDCDDTQLLYVDADGDSYGAGAPVACGVTSNNDCNDNDLSINPAAIEICGNFVDEDCDGILNNGCTPYTFYADSDVDSYGDPSNSIVVYVNAPPVGYVSDNTDCNDAVAAINPGAAEVCNNIDDNCNGLTDDGLVFVTYYADVDGDGFGNAAVSQSTCDGAPAGFILDNSDCDDTQLLYVDADGDSYGAGAPVACGVASSNDCNDAVAAINPGAAEVCNNIDDNCNGLTDDGLVFVTYYADVDGDGFGNAAVSQSTCDGAPAGFILDNSDCDDTQLLYVDADGDSYGAGAPVACGVASSNDCNDAVAAINPGAAEVCNNIDDNCNGLTDDGLVFVTYYADVDGDGFGNAAVSQSTCDGAPAGFILDNSDCDDTQLLYADADGDSYGAGAPVACGVASSNDCNDAVAAINPGAAEVCNNIDDNCNGLTDDGLVFVTYYADVDGDGFGNALVSQSTCDGAPAGFILDNSDCDDTQLLYADADGDSYGAGAPVACGVASSNDCNDAVAAINPGAAEVCNNIDDNCNGLTDDGLVFVTYYADVDGDGFGNALVSQSTCDGAPAGFILDNSDCDDTQLLYTDADGDSYGAGAPVACGVASSNDCNDAVAAINPGAAEVCNNIDDNCNGLTDDGLVFVTYYADVDGDGFGNALVSQSTCDGAPAGFILDNSDCDDTQLLYADADGDSYGAGAPVACGVASSNDCNDAVAAINPGAAEVCNNIDDNCNGLTDDGLVFVTYYADVDGDGFGNALVSQSTCDGAPAGFILDNSDCDDTQLLYADADGDSYGAGAPVACGVASSNDCNDAVAAINPGAAEVCNNIDDNCNGLTDDGLVFVTYYADVDGDGFGNAAVSQSTCDGAPAGFILDNSDCDDTQLLYADADGDSYGAGAPVACGVASSNDCNDAVAAINPGAAEVCNNIDDNCNGLTDDGLVFVTYYADVDGDGFGNALVSQSTCDGAPAGFILDNSDCDDTQLLYADADGDSYGAGAPVACGVASSNDCNDAVAAINPGAAEVCNNIDDNCNGLTDDGLVFVTYYADVDGDGFGNAAVSQSTCDGAPAGFILDNSDCDDTQLLYADADGDSYGAGAPVACGVASSNDCNDAVAAINPGAAEVCNNIDDNCNGLTDDGLVFVTYYADVDGDGFGNAAVSQSTCDGAPAGFILDNSDCDDTQLLYADADGDSYGAGAPVACGVASSNDCNDAVAAINPGAAEVCNNIDDNCNGLTDDGLVFVTYYADVDGDGFGNAAVSQSTCDGAPAGFILDNSDCDDTQLLYADADGDSYGAGAPVACGVASSNDCNDAVAAINPGAAEVCNNIDDNCNGLTDDGLVFVTYYADVDGDGFGNAAVSQSTCDGAPAGFILDNSDCDDTQLLYADADGDSYGAGAPVACGVASSNDCNDAVAAINPGAAEVCNNIDDNCNGLTDDGLVFVTYYADVDGDGFGNALVSQSTCDGAPAGFILDNSDCDDTQLLYTDADGDSYGAGAPVACGVASSNDCNDAVAAINPGAAEVCNNIDDNCNGLTDDGLVFVTYYADVDGDGFGNALVSQSTCDGAPAGFILDNSDCDDTQLLYADADGDSYGAGAPVACGVASSNDCNDAVAAINPGAAEVCNNIDDNCNGLTDDGLVFVTYYADVDGDGFGNALVSQSTCDGAPAGFILDNSDCDDTQLLYADADGDSYGAGAPVACGVASSNDCNDAVAAINPGAAEVCNNIDDNCNGLTDDGLVFVTYYADVDGDGFGNAAVSQSTCDGAPAGFILDNSDCDDTQLLYADADGDSYGAGAPVACGVASSNDCNDAVAAINPGAAEVCNNIDDNCNGLTDDGLVFVTYYADVDGDGFGNALVSQSTCDGAPAGFILDNSDCDDTQLLYADADGDSYGAGAPVACGVASSNDCNDAVAAINPGAAEVCNNIDDNCNGLTDDGLVFVTYYADADGDGFGNALVSQSTCDGAPAGFILDNSDCDDTQLLYADADGDSYGAGAPVACGVASSNDCNDAVAAINPGAAEVCNNIDDNCNGLTDDGLVFVTYYADVDGDGFGNALVSQSTCDGAPAGFILDNSDCDDTQLLYADADGDSYGAGAPVACGVASSNDCNDAVAAINPGAAEVCNNIDDNCNGLTDDGLVFVTYYADVDGDGFGNAAVSQSTCDGAPAGFILDNSDCDDTQLLYTDADGDSYGAGAPVACGVASSNDCNDAVAAINPGAAEVCNNIDDNCNGLTDDGLVFVTYYADVDGDGFGNALVSQSTCDGAPAGFILDNSDCDDTQLLYADADGDSYGAGAPVACGVASSNDCNDAVAAINPGAAEVCNNIDDNCNGLTDDGLVFVTYYADVDGDGFGNALVSQSTCDGAPAGFILDNSDCDDTQLLYADADGDSYGAGAPVACGVASSNDCNDAVAAINPGAAEVCNNIDDNCNGLTDDGLVFVTYYADVDGDGFGNALVSQSTCDGAPAGFILDNSDCDDTQLLYADADGDSYGAGAPVACGVASSNDCNDAVAAINPGAAEVCNNIDDNCNGLTDDGLVFVTYYADVDGDGFGNALVSQSTCDGAPAGFILDNSDCNDNDNAVNPAAIELCNSIDDDCDGLTDDNVYIPMGTISGPAKQCVPSVFNIATFSIPAAPGANNYTWSLPAGMTLVNGQGTTSILVSWTAIAVQNGIIGPMTVTATTPCGGAAVASVQVDINYTSPVTPPSISGPSKVCPGDNAIYSISNVARASSYIWTVPTGMTILNGQGTNVINVSVNSSYIGGTMAINAANFCGISPSRTKVLGINLPLTPGTISGLNSGLCATSNATFTTTGSANATSYFWTVPAGVTINSGQGSNSISVSVNGSFTSGNITVSGVNGCGTGSARSVTIYGAPGQPAAISGPVNVCPGQQNVAYEVPTTAGASSYLWTVPGGASIVSGQGTKAIVVNFGPNPANGQVISVKPSNACGQGGVRSLSGISLNFAYCGPRIGETVEVLGNLVIAPNPAKDNIQIRFEASEISGFNISLIDMSGRSVIEEQGEAVTGINNKMLNIEHLNSGIYMVIVRTNHEVKQVRLVVE